MNESLLNRILKDRKRRTRSLALILCLSMIVSLGTFAGFRKTAVAKVYTREVLDCPYTHEGAEPVAHVHNDDCYDGETLVCTLPELEAHTHSDACYTERQVLTCTLEENPGHQHGDACYTEREELRCGLEENPGHQHGDACYTEREVLRCGLEENPGHQHGEACYDENGVLTCQIPEGEGAHTHTAECYETVRELTCQIPEGEGAHAHTAECYETVRELTCQIPEGEGAHAHTAECYETVRELTCGKAELTPHVHGPECIRTEEITVDEPEVSAEPAATTQPEASAAPEMPVSDPNADLESASDWERDFDGMELSGNWAEDLVLVAATQQGHGESQNNFEAVLNDAGDAWVKHGYTRYGAWSGAPYADEWSAMFVSFCLRYAGIPAENVPNNPTAALMAESFQKGELFAGPDYLPAVGDLIFFDTDDEEGIDHMGIVYHVDEEDGSLNTVEGSRTDAVETFGYKLDDEEIAGYGILPQNPNFVPDVIENEDNIEGEDDGFIVMTTDEEEEKKETEEVKPVEETKTAEEGTAPAVPMPAQSWERTAGGIKVVVEAPEGAFPENTRIAATPVNGNSLKDTVLDAVDGEVLEVQAVDITFFNEEGQVIEPATAIRVVMTPAETENAEEKANVIHIDLDQQTAEVIEQAAGTETDNSEVVFDAESFTIYAIVYTVHFEYEVDGETYTSASMPGAEYTSLTEVIRGLGIVSEEEVGTFVSKISTVASTNEDVAVVENTDDGLCVRVLRDGDAQIVITMQDGATFRVDVVADGETATGNETATVSTVGELYLPTNAKVEAKVLPEDESESAIAAVEAQEETAGSTAAAETAYQVFDISLENVDAEKYNGFAVEVKLPENVVGRDFRLYHIHDGETKEIKLNTVSRPADDTGLEVVSGFTFETENFSEFVLKYTVDFTYEGRTWSFPGRGSYRLADVLAVLGIEGSIDDAGLTLILGEDHPGALYLTQVDGEYYINSDIPFVDTYELRVQIGEKIYIITVTDEQESSDLRNFLTKVTVSGAQLQDGAYVVEAGKRYTITMTFKERPDLQFENGATLTYQLPNGVVVPEATTEPITIAIVSGGKTYEIPATVTADTNGTITVKFDETDPNYSKLTAATNVSIRVKMDAMFSDNIDSHSWGDSIERDIELDTTDHSDVFTIKSGTFDEETGTYHYTIKVRSNGHTTNVNVKDVISGNALKFNNDVQVAGNSSDYTTNALSSGGKGFDYTFASMQDGEEITITYSASLDPGVLAGLTNGLLTADLTKNTVTVKKEGGEPHTAEYSHQIELKKPNKSNGNLIDTDADGNPIYSWRIEYNSLALAPAAGDVIKDTIAAGSQDYMKYSGNVRVRVYDHQGNEVTGSPRTFTPQSETSWSYTIPSGDTTPYRYVFEYETVVDKEKVNGTGTDQKLANTAGGPGGNTGGEITVGPSDKATITKAVESSDTEKITWVSVLHVPEGGLDTAVVTDRLPSIHTNNLELPGNYMIFDLYKEGSLNVDGLLAGETYEVKEEYNEQEQRHYVIITFKNDGNPGLKANPGGHDITIKLTTEVDQTWLKEGYRYPTGYQSEHVNSININGGEYVDARKRFVQPGLEKKGSELGDSSLKYFKYTLYLSQVNTPSISIDDTFDRSLLEVYDPFPYGDWNKQVFYITGGEAVGHVYPGEKSVKVNYADTETGIHIIANSVPLQDNGEYYPAYMITYFLKLKDGADLDALAKENGGQFDLTNTATWGDHESSYTFTTEYDFLDKKLLKEATPTDRHVQYQITFNPQKSELNGGKDIEMTDTLNENLSVDYTSIRITTEPEGMSVPYSFRGGKDENGNPDGRTIATYTVPDSTAVTITYDAMVVGNGRITYKNTVEAKGKYETVERTAEINIEGEGEGATADLNISKVDGNDANIKLEGVRFKLYSEKDKNGDRHDLSLDLSGVYEMILATDADGVLAIDGTEMRIVMGVKYYLEEIAAPDGYQILSTNPYQFTLVDDMDDVDYSHFVYFYHDTFQIKNYPLEGLVVGKTVESAEAADLTKEFTFEVSILKADGSVDTSVNQKYGDMTFENGVASFTLKHNQQRSAWNMPEGTKFKVEEKNAEGFTVSTTVGETTQDGTVRTGETSTDYTLVTFNNKKENGNGSLKIKKIVTENGNTPHSDAAKSKLTGTYTFTIYTNEACTEAYKVDSVAQTVSITIAADGAAVTSEEITGLPAGDYWIKETTPTNGSTPVTNPVKVTVVAGKTGEEAVIAEFTNNINLGSLEIIKNIQRNGTIDTNARGTFYYAVYDEEYNSSADPVQIPVAKGSIKVTENGAGKDTVSGLSYGTYYVYELDGENGTPIVSGTDGALAMIHGLAYTVVGSGTRVTVGAAATGTESGDGTGTPAGNGVTLINELTDFEFTKIWKDASQNNVDWPEDQEITVTVSRRISQNGTPETVGTYTIKKTATGFTISKQPAQATTPDLSEKTSTEERNYTFLMRNLAKSGTIDGETGEYTYFVTEAALPGYSTRYESRSDVTPDAAITLLPYALNRGTIINTPEGGYELPETGGIGTALFTALGGLMTATAGAVLTLRKKRKS